MALQCSHDNININIFQLHKALNQSRFNRSIGNSYYHVISRCPMNPARFLDASLCQHKGNNKEGPI